MKEIIFGKRTVIEALKSGISVRNLYIFKDMKNKEAFLKEAANLSNEPRLSPKEVSRRELELITENKKHGGIAIEIEGKQFVGIEQILLNARNKKEGPLLLVLNGIEDPHNLGAIIRCAEGSGVHGIILPKRRSARIGPTVARTSAGAIYHMLISLVANISQTLLKLKDKGIWIVGTEPSAEKKYYEIDFNLPIALVIGSEGKGIQRNVKEKCDFVVKIPMMGKIQSLNASVSAGILLYEALRQRIERKKII